MDRLIFRKVRALIGGRIRYIVCGGAPLSEESHLFTNVCFAPIMQGLVMVWAQESNLVRDCSVDLTVVRPFSRLYFVVVVCLEIISINRFYLRVSI